MKKLLCIALTILLLLSLSACGEEKKTIASSTKDTAKRPNNENQESTVNTCIGAELFSSLKEYEEKFPELQKQFPPQIEHLADFVTYDMIEEYGSFDSLVVPISSEIEYYYYRLVDDNGYKFALFILGPQAKNADLSKLSTLTNVENHKELRRSSEDEGVYSIGNLKYVYVEGKLSQIFWSTQNNNFMIEGTDLYEWLDSYSGEKPSLINSLLNAETAPAAIAEFNRKVSD